VNSGRPLNPLKRGPALSAAWGPTIVAALAGIAIAADVGRWIASAFGRATPAAMTTATRSPSEAPAVDVSAVGALFGNAAGERGGAPTELGAELELTGTLSLEESGGGFGIIRRRSEAEHLYRIGDVLPGGLRLAEVYRSHVVLEGTSGRAALWLPQAEFGRRALAAAGTERLAAAREDELIADSPVVRKTRAARIAHRVNVPSSPMARALNPRPVIADDHLLGYRFSSASGVPPIAGLPRGALVREIDGVPLSDGVVTGKALSAMAARGTATFVIRAGDGEKTITLDVSHLAQANP
jgi:general secretion pathway protein C